VFCFVLLLFLIENNFVVELDWPARNEALLSLVALARVFYYDVICCVDFWSLWFCF
jgi:hypothetical protein